MGNPTGKGFDSTEIRRVAREIDGLADQLDSLDSSMPRQVDAGVYGPHMTDAVHAALANVTDFIIRLRSAADRARQCASAYDAGEYLSTEPIANILRLLDNVGGDS